MDGLALALALLSARDLGVAEVRSALPDAPVVPASLPVTARRGLIGSWLDLFRVDDPRGPRAHIRIARSRDQRFA
jgi:hypothetical protein